MELVQSALLIMTMYCQVFGFFTKNANSKLILSSSGKQIHHKYRPIYVKCEFTIYGFLYQAFYDGARGAHASSHISAPMH